MKKQRVFHPLLFAAYPILFLFSNNVWQTDASVIWIPLALVLGVTTLSWLLLSHVLRDKAKAAVITSNAVILMFVYEPVHGVLFGQHGLAVARHRFLLPVFGSLLLLGIYLVMRARKHVQVVNGFMNVVAVTLVIVALPDLGNWAVKRSMASIDSVSAIRPREDEHVTLSMPDSAPDIYYIILDGYMRSDLMSEVLGYDNGEFVGYLEGKGFYVASKSRSNYPYTFLSIPSSLNMEYVNYLSETVGRESHNVLATYPMIQANRVGRLLKSIGYRYVQVNSGWSGANRSLIADEVRTWRNAGSEEPFNYLLLEMTALYPLVQPLLDSWRDERGAILFSFEQISQLGNQEQPTFVYAHIVSPHPPYVFGANGEHVQEPEEGWNPEGAQRAYLNQLIFINDKVVELIDKLLVENVVSPIIILQADHGWAWAVGWDPNPNVPLDERFDMDQVFGILNAYHLPGNGRERLYESISPVNSFRLIFNAYFGASFELLRDESYFSVYYESPFNFINVTDRLDH